MSQSKYVIRNGCCCLTEIELSCDGFRYGFGRLHDPVYFSSAEEASSTIDFLVNVLDEMLDGSLYVALVNVPDESQSQT